MLMNLNTDLPESVGHSTMIEYNNSVILIGGSGSVDGHHMYQLSSPKGPKYNF